MLTATPRRRKHSRPVPPRPRFLDLPWHDDHPRFQVLDSLLHPDHPARWIAQAVAELDLAPLRRSYHGRGSWAYPPAPLLAFTLYMLLEGQTSPAAWARDARRNDDARWLLRGLTPSRSQFYTFRSRLGPCLDAWHRQVLDRARADGLLQPDRVSLDGTLVAAYASRHRVLSGATLQRRLALLRARVGCDELQALRAPAVLGVWLCWQAVLVPLAAEGPAGPWRRQPPLPAWVARTPRGRRQQLGRYERAWARLGRQEQEQAARPRGKRVPIDELKVSPSDPEAALGRDKLHVYRPLYNVQLVQATDVPLTVAFAVVGGSNDQGQLRPLLEQTERQTGVVVREALVDEGYLNIPDLTWCAGRGTEVFAPPKQGAEAAAAGRGQLPKAAFAWEPGQGYRCPEGQLLRLKGRTTEYRAMGPAAVVLTYRGQEGQCQGCPRRGECLSGSARARTVRRYEGEEVLERLGERMGREGSRQLYKLRARTVERGNADLKQHRGLRVLGGYGREAARAQVGLTLLATNVVSLRRWRLRRDNPDPSPPLPPPS
jgi:transposase